VDGCPGGWVAAVWTGDDVTWRALPLAFDALLAGLADCAVVAVDVPIGMPETGKRACDLAARAVLKGAASSVFLTPVRAVLAAPDHATGCAIGKATEGWAPSIQAWGIRDRVLGAEVALGNARVVEAHPEVSFHAMTGRVLPSKRSAPGLGERLVALSAHFADVPGLLRAAPPPARADDALDALACAWTARRVLSGTAGALGEPPMVIRA
jgi:predicted RNase H-like nuclease